MPEPVFHVSVVCTGNICRSPMAAIVLRSALDDAGLGDRVRVTSAGTGPWHVGGPAHASARRVLEQAGFATDHIAHQITREELPTIDLVLAADRSHLAALRTLQQPGAGGKGGKIGKAGKKGTSAKAVATDPPAGDAAEIKLFRSFDPAADHDELPDPYGGPDEEYVQVMGMVRAAVPGIVDEIRRRLG